MRRATLIAVLLVTLLLEGCITWDGVSVNLRPSGPETGSFTVTLHGLGSDAADSRGRDTDLALLYYDVISNTELANDSIAFVRKELVERGGRLDLVITGRYMDSGALAAMLNISRDAQGYRFVPRQGESVVNTDGREAIDFLGRMAYDWPADAGELNMEVSTGGEGDSLLDEFRRFSESIAEFAEAYRKSRHSDADRALSDKRYADAYDAVSAVLRNFPTDDQAVQRERELRYAKYYDLLGYVQLPYIDMSLAVDMSTHILDPDIYVDVDAEVFALKTAGGHADLCRAYVILRKNGRPGDADRVLALLGPDAFESGAGSVPGDAGANMCIADVLYETGRKADAVALYERLLDKEPALWEAYSTLLVYYSMGAASDPVMFGRISSELDLAVGRYINETPDPPPAMAYGIFRALYTRNMLIQKMSGASAADGQIVEELAYRMLMLAADASGKEPAYNAAMGTVELYLLYVNLVRSLDYADTDARGAMMRAMGQVIRQSGALIDSARGRLESVETRWPGRHAFIYKNLAFTEMLAMNLEKAEAYYNMAIETEPGNDSLYIALAAFYTALYPFDNGVMPDKSAKLIKLLAGKTERFPSAEAYYLLGSMQAMSGELSLACQRFEDALRADGMHYPSMVGAARCALADRPESASGALKNLDEYLARLPGGSAHEELVYLRGLALAFGGRDHEAYMVLAGLLPDGAEHPMPGLVEALRRLRNLK